MATNDKKKPSIQEEIEAGKKAKAEADAKKEVEQDLPEDMTSIDVKGEIKFLDLDQVDFDPKWNIRDVSLMDGRVQRKVAELTTDGYIRTPLVACQMRDAKDQRPRGACGFLRYHALRWLQENEPEFFLAKFAGKIPFKVVADATERDRELLMYDHGLEEELDEWEVFLAQKRLMRTGLYTQKAMINVLAKMYYKLAGVDERRRYNERLKELTENGMVLIGSQKVRTIEDARLHTFRGRFQYFQRIAESKQVVEDHFKKQCRGEKVPKITFKAAEELHKCDTDTEALEYLAAIGKKQDSGDATPRTWGKGKLESAKKVTKSTYFVKQLEAALGDDAAASALPELEDELIKIERAKAYDPKAFWAFVDKQIEAAEAAAPSAKEVESEEASE